MGEHMFAPDGSAANPSNQPRWRAKPQTLTLGGDRRIGTCAAAAPYRRDMGSPFDGISQGMLRCACGDYATIQMFGIDYCDAHAPEPHDLEREVEVQYGVQITRVVCHDCDTATEWRVDDSLVPGLDGTALSEILPCMQFSISRPIEIRPVPGSDEVWEIVREVDPDELEE